VFPNSAQMYYFEVSSEWQIGMLSYMRLSMNSWDFNLSDFLTKAQSV
jgi:hypothetical protein